MARRAPHVSEGVCDGFWGDGTAVVGMAAGGAVEGDMIKHCYASGSLAREPGRPQNNSDFPQNQDQVCARGGGVGWGKRKQVNGRSRVTSARRNESDVRASRIARIAVSGRGGSGTRGKLGSYHGSRQLIFVAQDPFQDPLFRSAGHQGPHALQPTLRTP